MSNQQTRAHATDQAKLDEITERLRQLGSLFSGGGGWDAGALAVGIRPVFAVEYEPWIARWHARVFGDHVAQGSVADVDYRAAARRFGPIDVLVSSPPCQDSSASGKAWKTRRRARGLPEPERVVCDPHIGLHTLAAVDGFSPRAVLLENNAGYANGATFRAVADGLRDRGYAVDHRILHAEDYGVVSGRERLILRAVRRRRLPPWPAPVPRPSWYEAIRDVIPEMDPTPLAAWQAKGLRDNPPPPGEPLLIAGGNPNRNKRGYVVHRTTREAAWTTQLAKNTSGMRVIGTDGVPRLMSARGIARLQGFPDWYPIDGLLRTKAIHILGNSVPPVLAAALLAPFA